MSINSISPLTQEGDDRRRSRKPSARAVIRADRAASPGRAPCRGRGRRRPCRSGRGRGGSRRSAVTCAGRRPGPPRRGRGHRRARAPRGGWRARPRGCPAGALVTERAQGRGDERVPVAQVRGDERARAPPRQLLVTEGHRAPAPLQVQVVGEDQDRAVGGDRAQIGGHQRVPHRRQPGHPSRGGVGHPVVVAQQADGGPRVQLRALPVGRAQPRRLGLQQRDQVVGDQPQPPGVVALADRPGGVQHRGLVRPPRVGAEQLVDRLPGARRAVDQRVQAGERLPRARRPVLQRAVDPEEPEPVAVPFVVLPHPAHQLAVGGEGAEAVAEAALHDLVEVAGAGGDVLVDQEGLEAVALDGERAEALVLDQVPEDRVTRLAQLGHEVHGLAQAEQVWPGGQ